MKSTLLISLGKESYSNVSIEFEGTADEAIAEGKRLLSVQNAGPGVPAADWNRILDGILKGTGKLSAEEWELMDDKQKFMLNELKKSRNRKS